MTGRFRRRPLAIVGLDGGTFRVLEPMVQAGVMPTLDGMVRRGLSAVLRSTVPAYTPPGWASMTTGVNPGKHNTFGFLANTPQEPARLAHSGHVAAPAMWEYLNRGGLRVGVFNVPMSYPPVKVDGFMVAGGIAAGWQDPELPGFASEPAIADLINRVTDGHYPLDTQVSYELDWRSVRVAERVERVQRIRRRALGAVLDAVDVNVLYAVFEGVDRLQHLHYQYLVPWSDWYDRPEAAEARERARSYFAELDAALADIVAWAGDDGHVILVSDHGGGPWEKTLNVNLLLDEWGYLAVPALAKAGRLRAVAGPGVRLGRRLLPRSVVNRVKARIGRAVAWERTKAFAAQVAEQGIHVNQAGDLPKGILSEAEAAGVERELTDRLSSYVDPDDGRPVVDRIIRRGDALSGPFVSRAPHLFPFCRDQRYEISDTLVAAGPLTDHRDRPWGCHHSDGILIASGPGVSSGWYERGFDIVDVLPTALHLLGEAIPTSLDGRLRVDALQGEPAGREARREDVSLAPAGTGYPFSEQQEREIEESLRALGYVE
ncbi:MAG: alkaline phosphatase family protein [Actinomycetota bacterium]